MKRAAEATANTPGVLMLGELATTQDNPKPS